MGQLRTGGDGGLQPYLNNLVTAVCAPAMSLSGRDGQMRREGVEGLYVQDVRALSQLVLTVDGSEPVPLGYELVGGAANEFDGAVAGAGNPGPDLTVFVSRRRALNPAGMVETSPSGLTPAPPSSCHVELQVGVRPGRYLGSPFRPAPGGPNRRMPTAGWPGVGRPRSRFGARRCSPGPARHRRREGLGLAGTSRSEPGRR